MKKNLTLLLLALAPLVHGQYIEHLISGVHTANQVGIIELDPSSVLSWSNAPIYDVTGRVVRASGRLLISLPTNTGPQGATGATGAQGPQGLPGANGLDGAAGAAATISITNVITGFCRQLCERD